MTNKSFFISGLLITLFQWFFYPVIFCYTESSETVWTVFIMTHIMFCLGLWRRGVLIMGDIQKAATRNPHVINCEGHILFPGIEIYTNDFVENKVVRKYGLLDFDNRVNGWYVRWENSVFSQPIHNPETLRYEPHEKSTRYEEINRNQFTTNVPAESELPEHYQNHIDNGKASN